MMDYFAVEGGRPLEGRVFVHGAKNSALPLLAATLLADGESVLHNCPDLTDISAALGILSGLGCRVRREGATVMVDPTCRRGYTIPDELMGQMRASVLFLGSLLARDGEAVACWRELPLGELDIVQLSAARGQAAGPYHLMMGQNPVYLICGEGQA